MANQLVTSGIQGDGVQGDSIQGFLAAAPVPPVVTAYLDFDGVLNAIAGTTDLCAQGAANAWAGTTDLELLGALNTKNGTVGLGLNLVVAEITGYDGYEATEALNLYNGWTP